LIPCCPVCNTGDCNVGVMMCVGCRCDGCKDCAAIGMDLAEAEEVTGVPVRPGVECLDEGVPGRDPPESACRGGTSNGADACGGVLPPPATTPRLSGGSGSLPSPTPKGGVRCGLPTPRGGVRCGLGACRRGGLSATAAAEPRLAREGARDLPHCGQKLDSAVKWPQCGQGSFRTTPALPGLAMAPALAGAMILGSANRVGRVRAGDGIIVAREAPAVHKPLGNVGSSSIEGDAGAEPQATAAPSR